MKVKPHLLIVCLTCTAVFVSSSVLAQKPTASPAPSAAKPPFQVPDMGAMWGQMMNVMFTELTRPERAAQLARFQRLYYEALLKEGFTKEEALSIIKATQIPTMGPK